MKESFFQRISFKPFLFSFLAGLVVLAAGLTFYGRYVGEMLETDATERIEMDARETAVNFERAISADRRTLETIAITAEAMYPWKDEVAVRRFLKEQTQFNGYSELGILTLAGRSIVSGASAMGTLWAQDVLARTLDKKVYLSESTTVPPDGAGMFAQAVALQNGGKSSGVIYALLPAERYQSLLSLSSIGLGGFSFIITRDGRLVLGEPEISFANVFDMNIPAASFTDEAVVNRIRTQVGQGETMLTSYRAHGERHIIYGRALGENNWYMVSVLHATGIETQARRLTWLSLGLFGFIFCVFCLLLSYVIRLRAEGNRRLFNTAFVDPLTGADNLNRMTELFEDKLAALNAKAALVIFDITKFKVINDMYGFERGNQVLQRVARILREELTEDELFCRSSADRFLLLLAYENRPLFHARLNHLAAQIRRDCTEAESCLMVDAAFGVYEIKEDIPFYIMMDRAHLALAKAKRAASDDKIQFYDEKDRHRILTERQIESSMEQALEDGSFSVYLQPKCDFKTGDMVGAEALVRWNRVDRGLVRPDDFIPIFERNGFILRLDMFILEQAAKLLKQWKDAGKQQVPIAVNFSRLHLNDPRYIAAMTHVVDKYQLPHNLIEVELTESVILNNLELAKNVIRGLHRRGFSVAMDDFGSGYSSLNVLKSLQFDGIKLDKEFLSGFEQNDTAKKVIEGTVEMIKTLGIAVIAEGVETKEQTEFLRKIGCDVAQGYYFSRPLPVDEFEQRLKQTA